MLGVVSAGAPVPPEPVATALERLARRGPDGQGSWRRQGGRVVLGHRRLAIVGGAEATQPLVGPAGRARAVINGELYGYRTQRAELEASGTRFATDGDSELLVALYEALGPAAVRQLRGEFAWVLWDEPERRLVAARDAFGVKPLCWARTADRVIVASGAKAILPFLPEARWDRTALVAAFSHQYPPPDRTMFAGVRQLPPGHRLIVDTADGLHCRVERWAPAPALQAGQGGAPASPADLLDALAEAVSLRTQGESTIACALSGGIDSSLVSALFARETGRRPRCFGVTFPDDPAVDESGPLRTAARALEAELVEVPATAPMLREAMPAAVWHAEGLAINAHLPAKFRLSEAVARAGCKVILTGEGADELLFGYPHLIQDRLAADGGAGASERAAIQALRRADPAAAAVMMSADAEPDAQPELLARLGYVPAFLAAKRQLSAPVRPLLRSALRAAAEAPGALAAQLDAPGMPALDRLRAAHPVEASAALWTRLVLAGYILRTLGDGTEMAHSVEGRTPFLDRRVVATAARLPLSDKLPTSRLTKRPLRQAAEGLLPPEIVARPKHPFLAPPIATGEDGRVIPELLERAAGLSILTGRGDGLADLRASTPQARRRLEPGLMMLWCAALLEERFGLGEPR